MFEIHPAPLRLEEIGQLLTSRMPLRLSSTAKEAIKNCRTYLDQKLESSNQLFYGINTGFGNFCNLRISGENVEQLQANLLVSHACGMGEEVPQDVVKLMLLLKIRNLSFGHSAASLELVETLIHFYNNDILPVVYQLGSLGASGDLSPLAHLSLPLIGKGFVRFKGIKMASSEVPDFAAWDKLRLKSKEGLALLNGTQFSLAYGVWSALKAKRISKIADMNAALAVDAFDCRLSPFDERIHATRPHKGQLDTAQNIRTLLKGSEIALSEKQHVQDPYAFRCVPQVHGATKDTLNYVIGILETEINAVTDNPILFPETDGIISGGNFHAQPIALALDFLAIAVAELASISERRIFQLISGKRGLPTCLTGMESGLHSGLMIPQYTAASIVSQNKQLCTPASIDSIVSANGQEDHVSMAANAATKLYRVVNNVRRVLAIEFMNCAQALDFRKPMKTSPQLEGILAAYRKGVPHLEEDRLLHDDMVATIDFLARIPFV